MFCPICSVDNSKKINIETQEVEQGLSMALCQCKNCGVLFAEDFQKERTHIYGENYGAWSIKDEKEAKQIAYAKSSAFRFQFGKLTSFINPVGKKILDIGVGGGYLLQVADSLGFDCYGTEISSYWAEVSKKKFPGRIFSGPLPEAGFKSDFFDVVCMTDVLEHLAEPQKILEEISRILKPSGYIMIISPNSSSLTRKIFGKNWFQYKYEHVFYFNKKSLKYALRQSGFELVKFENNKKKFPLSYYYCYFRKYSFLGIGKVLNKIYPFLPLFVKNFCFLNPITGEFLAIAQKNKK